MPFLQTAAASRAVYHVRDPDVPAGPALPAVVLLVPGGQTPSPPTCSLVTVEVVGHQSGGVPSTSCPETRTVSFGTEGGLFQAIGVPTVVCGPGHIEQAHKADEFVTLDQLSKCLDFLDALALRIAGGTLRAA